MTDLTFKKAVIVAAVPSIIGIFSTYYSKEVSDKQAVVQARITERDLAYQEALEVTTKDNPVFAYMIPIANNTAWSNYYECRVNDKDSRLNCVNKQKGQKMNLTPELVKNYVNFGF